MNKCRNLEKKWTLFKNPPLVTTAWLTRGGAFLHVKILYKGFPYRFKGKNLSETFKDDDVFPCIVGWG